MLNSPGEDVRLHTDGPDTLRDKQCEDDHKVNRRAVGLIPQTYLLHQGGYVQMLQTTSEPLWTPIPDT